MELIWPKKGIDHLKVLFANYYNQIPDGIINDRWLTNQLSPEAEGASLGVDWTDYQTAEYHLGRVKVIAPYKWEMCRGLSFSFGFNQNEEDDQIISSSELIKLFVDIVSKNGNLLINIGPRAEGTIPEEQVGRLTELGRWLEINNAAIFGSRPWLRAEGSTASGMDLRFTQNKESLYITLLGEPAGQELIVKSVIAENNSTIKMLGVEEELKWQQKGTDLVVNLPGKKPVVPVGFYSLQISPAASDVVKIQ